MSQRANSELLQPGTLRVGINLGNTLLVTGRKPNGDPEGIAPDMASGIADRLGVNIVFDTFASAGEVADAAKRGEWDIGLLAIEPERAAVIDFCDAYVEIEATYLVPEGSEFQTVEEVDAPGVRIAVSERAAYDLYLTRTLKHAALHRAKGLQGALELFRTEKLDALAGLVPPLKGIVEQLPGSRLLPGRYTAVQQTIGTRHGNSALKAVVQDFIADAKGRHLVQQLIDKYGGAGKLSAVSGD